MLIGKWINEGKTPYKDIFFNHQPYPLYISAIIQKTGQINSTFLLIKRHREFIFLLSFVLAIFLAWRYSFLGFCIVLAIESIKSYFLGNLFLAESLVIYPIIIEILLFYEISIMNRKTWFNIICLSILTVYISFTLLPLIFFTTVVFLFVLIKSDFKKKIAFILLTLIHIVGIFLVIPIKNYYFDNIYINFFHYIPQTQENLQFLNYCFNSFLKIFAMLFSDKIPLFLYSLNLFFILLFFQQIYRKKIKFILFSLSILILLNLRPQIDEKYYQGFHMLPFYSGLITLFFIIFYEFFKEKNLCGNLKAMFIYMFSILLLLLGGINIKNYSESIINKQQDEYYINYSHDFTYADTLNIMKNDNNTFYSVSQKSLIYWQSNMRPPFRYFFLFGFMLSDQSIKQDFNNVFMTKPPDFLYMHSWIKEIDDQKIYYHLKKDGEFSDLFVKKKVWDKMDPVKKQLIKTKHGFSI